MGWKVELQHGKSKLNFITYLENNDELGHFLLNLDKDYEVRFIEKTYHDELKESEKFLKKDTNIEFGKKEGK